MPDDRCPFCLFVPEDGLDELASHLNGCSGRLGYGGIDALAQYGRAERAEDALRRILTLVAEAAESGTGDPLLDSGISDSEAVARIGGEVRKVLRCG